MRDEMEAILKDELRILALKTRARHSLSQEEMAEALAMVPRSYTYIESGVHMCGTLTTVLLLIDHPDPLSLLADWKRKFDSLYSDEEKIG